MEGFIDKSYWVEHPHGEIRLLDGRIINGFPKSNPQTDIKGGSYDLFITKAHWLFDHSEAILQDSCMFLTPLDIDNNLSITGRYGFQNPTLGVYIEWWLNCRSSVIHLPNGKFSLVCFMSGSLLSGMNLCLAVDENGTKEKVTIRPFQDLWQPFISINTRYDSCKASYEAYTFETVLSILQQKSEKNNEIHC